MKVIFIMMLFMNMVASVTLGNVRLDNVSGIEVSENIDEISNTAKIVIPRAYQRLDDKAILEQFKVGDKVEIRCGYQRGKVVDMEVEFTGYIREIESDRPVVVHCDDESYVLRQTNIVKSYKDAKLLAVLKDIVPAGIKVEAPDVSLGRLAIDNASAFAVLQQLKEDYGLYARLRGGVLSVGLRDMDRQAKAREHTYTLNPEGIGGNLVRKNDLKFKRKEDFRLQVKATALGVDGKKKTVEVGSKDKLGVSVISVTYPGKVSEAELKKFALSILNKRSYDGYTGSVTGFGTPRTHAGDVLSLLDAEEPERAGRYLIEKVDVAYGRDGYSRRNTLSYKL